MLRRTRSHWCGRWGHGKRKISMPPGCHQRNAAEVAIHILKSPFPQCLGWSHRQLPPKPIGPITPTNPDHNQPHLAITCNPKRFSICSPQWTVRLQQCYYCSLRWDATPRYTRRRTSVAYGHSIQLMNGSSPWINSLTAMVSYMRLFFFELLMSLISFRIFVRCQRLIARNVADGVLLFSLADTF
jgi:hypothetical protein